ncbi:glucosamine inositolphosphorylceramide transferase family protein [Halorientalis marina]|uniref:glucosamine inositolphosphorylceramide transferase family protein n=1 Tax=Halorientalis marina TaxID=2931976 RepID=UPI001FF63EC1|nr:hypothetical protein [Halorientalis marina]
MWLKGSAKNIIAIMVDRFVDQVHYRIPESTPKKFKSSVFGGLKNKERGNFEDVLENTIYQKSGCNTNGCGNPVLTSDDVTDFGDVDFVADPFLLPLKDEIHLFFEVMNRDKKPNSAIGHATSDNGHEWAYDQIVLETGRHVSFPFIFENEGDYYMLPEQSDPKSDIIELYKANSFPTEWKRCSTLLEPEFDVQDAILFQWDEYWWLLIGSGHYDEIHLYYSNFLERNEWHAHKNNPVVTDRQSGAKPAGRPIITEERIILFLQDCVREYGDKVRVYTVDQLNPTEYSDTESPFSPVIEGTGGVGWNSGRMHHIDPHWIGGEKWICAVDGDIGFPRGYVTGDHWSIGIYHAVGRNI